MVSLSNVSKGCEGATVPAVAALTLPRPAQEKGKDGLFSSLLRISLLFLIVLASKKSNRLLQTREIRRIGFSVAYRHDLRFTCKKVKNAAPIDSKSKLERRACFVSFCYYFLKLQIFSFFTSSEKLKAPFALHKNKAAKRQPCLLSLFYSLKPMQFGFFGFLGSFFPKKLPKWGMGRSPIKIVPHVGVRGAEPRYLPSPCGVKPRE